MRREYVKPHGASEARYRADLSVRDGIFKPHDHCIGPRRGRSLGAKTDERRVEPASFRGTNGRGERVRLLGGMGGGLGDRKVVSVCAEN